MKDWKTETITIREMTMTRRTLRQEKGGKAKADDFTTEAKGGKAKVDNLTEAKGSKARADNLATEAKGGKARIEENSNKSEAATEMINEQGRENPICHGKRIPA